MTSSAAPLVLTAAEACAAMHGVLVHGDGRVAIDRIAIDSRTVPPGALFIAIVGERFDGAAFAGQALVAGACGVVVSRASGRGAALAEQASSAVVIEVEDTTAALQALGRHVRRASGARVVAITGSAGKTTTKETAAEFLAARYRVYRNPGNFNNHIGLPLSLFELRERPEVAVVELGMNHAGEIRRLVGLAEPDVRVWTNVGDAHVGYFGSADAIADAKAEILEGASAGTLLVANADDPRVAQRIAGFPGRTVTFGTAPGAGVRALEVEDLGIGGTRARIETPAGSATVRVPLLGRGNLLNVLAAAAVALALDVPLDDIVERATTLRPARHRGEIVRLREGATLVDDSYNSSPAALRRTLEALARDTAHARKVAVLGEMLELGDLATDLHEQSGRAVAESGVSVLIAVGGDAAAVLARAAAGAGLGASALHVATSEEAAAIALDEIRAGDLVLVKGSRGIRTDVVVDRLVERWS